MLLSVDMLCQSQRTNAGNKVDVMSKSLCSKSTRTIRTEKHTPTKDAQILLNVLVVPSKITDMILVDNRHMFITRFLKCSINVLELLKLAIIVVQQQKNGQIEKRDKNLVSLSLLRNAYNQTF